MYIEAKFAYVVSDQNSPKNYPVYAIEEDMGCCILAMNEYYEDSLLAKIPIQYLHVGSSKLWKMYFDGSSPKEGEGAGIFLFPLVER